MISSRPARARQIEVDAPVEATWSSSAGSRCDPRFVSADHQDVGRRWPGCVSCACVGSHTLTRSTPAGAAEPSAATAGRTTAAVPAARSRRRGRPRPGGFRSLARGTPPIASSSSMKPMAPPSRRAYSRRDPEDGGTFRFVCPSENIDWKADDETNRNGTPRFGRHRLCHVRLARARWPFEEDRPPAARRPSARQTSDPRGRG